MPTITAQLFTPAVANERHPVAIRLRHAILDLADDYDARITRFEVRNGVVTVDISSVEMCARVLVLLNQVDIQVVEIMTDRSEFERRSLEMRRKK